MKVAIWQVRSRQYSIARLHKEAKVVILFHIASLEDQDQTLNFSQENTGRNSPNLMSINFQKARLHLRGTHIGPPNHLTNPLRQGMRVDSSSEIRNRDQQPRAGQPTIPRPAKILMDCPNRKKKVIYLILPDKIKKSWNNELVEGTLARTLSLSQEIGAKGKGHGRPTFGVTHLSQQAVKPTNPTSRSERHKKHSLKRDVSQRGCPQGLTRRT
ncbi:hypothetical protein E2C01_022662 [Portunus trituberculatus]|uniref:Uncharacterized protein n=1 Tax=Portunus trituberculatus TaxID=210409 RepID=A0A5B7E5Z1_PORTR|nr:hypothetical protein [Portunus trituberculatus]